MTKLAFYDFSVSPYSYDFMSFIMCARAVGAEQVVFVPGKRLFQTAAGETREFQKCSPEEQASRMKHLLIPLARHLGNEPVVCETREEARKLWKDGDHPTGYTVEKPKHTHMLANVLLCGKVRPLKPKAEALSRARALLGDNAVVITIRENSIRPTRNSDIPQWVKAAEWMVKRGLQPFFIPDTEHPYRTFGAFPSIPDAALDVDYRLALYHTAHLNVGVTTGPTMLLQYSRCPYLQMKPLGPTWEVSEEYWRMNGCPPGAQLPWFTDLQRIVWGRSDDCEAITAAVNRWLIVKSRAGQKQMEAA